MKRLALIALLLACAHTPDPLVAPPKPKPRAEGRRREPISELHAHVFHRDSIGQFFSGYPDSKFLATDPGERFVTQITTDALLAANVRLVFSYAYVPSLIRAERSLRTEDHEEAMRQVEKAARFARDDPRWDVVTTRAEADAALSEGRIALVLGIEGAGDVVRSAADVDAFWEKGVRVVTLAHFSDGAVAGSARSSLEHPENFNFFGKGTGLTDLGRVIVVRMAERGMIIDLAHASDATSRDVLEATKGTRAKVVISHTALRALHPSERNTSDEIAKAVAERGGVIGLTLWPMQTSFAGVEDCRAFGAHFRRLLELVGPEHIAVGADWNGGIDRPRACEGRKAIANVRDVPALLDSLQDEGVPPEVLDGMTSNVLRLLP